jgi:hypothetical protein
LNTNVNISDDQKDEIMKKRNRENAALTRKRQRIYAEFLDKAIEELEQVLSGEKDFVIDEAVQDEEASAAKAKRKATKKRPTTVPTTLPKASLAPPPL